MFFEQIKIISYSYNKEKDSIYLTLKNEETGACVSAGTDFGSDVYIKNILKITDSSELDEIVGKTVKCNKARLGTSIKWLQHLTKPIRMMASREIEILPHYK